MKRKLDQSEKKTLNDIFFRFGNENIDLMNVLKLNFKPIHHTNSKTFEVDRYKIVSKSFSDEIILYSNGKNADIEFLFFYKKLDTIYFDTYYDHNRIISDSLYSNYTEYIRNKNEIKNGVIKIKLHFISKQPFTINYNIRIKVTF